MKKLTTTERTALLLLAAILLVFLTIRLTQYYAQDGEIEPQAVGTATEIPAVVTDSVITNDSLPRHNGKRRHKSRLTPHSAQPSSPKSRDYLDQPIN